MKADFTRNTFDPLKHFTRVLMQQGRVQLDADWNEQTAILLHNLQALAADLIGPHGGPSDNCGFRITQASGDPFNVQIGNGHYYIDGVLCENEGKRDGTNFSYRLQPNYPPDKDQQTLTEGSWLIYLDVWERHLTYIEVESPDNSVISIREVALGGPDTATRAQIVWQVKVMRGEKCLSSQELNQIFQPAQRGRLKARAKQESKPTDPCLSPPDARYRRTENQLYRVEIHQGGTAWNGVEAPPENAATFKWSRENGSVIFPIVGGAGTKILTLENLGRDDRFGLKEGDWVEVQDDDYILHNRAGKLRQVRLIDRVSMTVTLNDTTDQNVGKDPAKHPLLRRWDHKERTKTEGRPQLADDGTALIEEGKWLSLEDGVQIQFQSSGNNNRPNSYRTGDYWLIPARTATGDVEWPGPVGDPVALPPHGVVHHYAPLAVIALGASGNVTVQRDCRYKFDTLAKPM